MNVAVVTGGGLTEALQAGPLLASLGEVDGDRVVLAGPPAASALAGSLVGTAETLPLAALADPVRRPHVALIELRRRRLDTAAICSSRATDRLLAYAAGCPRRIGISDGRLSHLLTDAIDADGEANRSAAWLRLAPALGATPTARPWLDPGAPARQRAEALLVGGGIEDGRLLVAMAPSNLDAAETPGVPRDWLRWDPERYGLLANQLSHRHGAGLVILGAAEDRDLVDRMLLDVEAPFLDLCGELSLAEMGAVVERCNLVVSGDSPALHIAAGVGTPSVGLFGPTEGVRRGPVGEQHRVVQAFPDGSASQTLERVRIDDVIAAIEARL